MANATAAAAAPTNAIPIRQDDCTKPQLHLLPLTSTKTYGEMVCRFSDTTSPTKEGLSQSGGIVSNPHNDFIADWTNPEPRPMNSLHRSVWCGPVSQIV